MDDSFAIRCRDLVKDYGAVRAVNGLDLEIRAGECFGLLGPNGAGKTTTVEILEGLLAPTSGEVELLGCNWKTDGASLRQRLGISLQETNLADKLTVEETLRLCERVAIVDKGKVIALGTPRALIESLGGTDVVEIKCDAALDEASLSGLAGVHTVKAHAEGLSVTVEHLHTTLPRLLAHL